MEDIPQGPSGSNTPLPRADFDQVLKERVQVLRKSAGLTQRQLADQMTSAGYRMHQTTIAKIEAGERPVIVGEAAALAIILGVGLADLITDPAQNQGRRLAEVAELMAERHRWQQNVAESRAKIRLAEAELAEARAQLEAVTGRINALMALPFVLSDGGDDK